MTAPSLLDELEEVVRRITDDTAEVRRTGGDPERERYTQRIVVNFIRTHHTEIADMAKRLEAADKLLREIHAGDDREQPKRRNEALDRIQSHLQGADDEA